MLALGLLSTDYLPRFSRIYTKDSVLSAEVSVLLIVEPIMVRIRICYHSAHSLDRELLVNRR